MSTRRILIDRSYKAVRLVHALVFGAAIVFLDSSQISSVYAIISFVLSFLAVTFGVNIINHRYCAHRLFETGSVTSFFLLFFHAFVGLNSPITSSVMHEAHHKYSDTDLDPHPYPRVFLRKLIFFFRIYFHTLYVAPSLKRVLFHSRRNWFLFFHKYGGVIHLILTFALFMVGLKYLFFLQTIPVLMAFLCHYWLAGPLHSAKNINADTRDYSIDSALLNVLTLGEGSHHLHHKYPKAVYLPLSLGNRKVWYFDLTGYLIKLFFRRDAFLRKERGFYS